MYFKCLKCKELSFLYIFACYHRFVKYRIRTEAIESSHLLISILQDESQLILIGFTQTSVYSLYANISANCHLSLLVLVLKYA